MIFVKRNSKNSSWNAKKHFHNCFTKWEKPINSILTKRNEKRIEIMIYNICLMIYNIKIGYKTSI
jgi:hypothetical protein